MPYHYHILLGDQYALPCNEKAQQRRRTNSWVLGDDGEAHTLRNHVLQVDIPSRSSYCNDNKQVAHYNNSKLAQFDTTLTYHRKRTVKRTRVEIELTA